ncbi:MAG: OmpA family protein [Candidatus Ancillula sp.]|jgi:outer membrane protein OmpA-like peptidoglycan-associated protein|nr:OmpA family protein [Candidatus Ancillula sp.]
MFEDDYEEEESGGSPLRLIIFLVIVGFFVYLVGWVWHPWSGLFKSDNKPESSIGIVVGNVQGSPVAQITDEAKEKLLDQVDKYEIVKVNIYDVDSNNTSSQASIDTDKINSPNSNTKQNAENDLIGTINSKIKSLKPKSSNADYMNTIEKAADQLTGEQPLLIVAGSGLSDTGTLNFASDNFLTSDKTIDEIKDQYIESNKSESNKYKEKNISLILTHLGETTLPQSFVSDINQKEKLQNIYKGILSKMGFNVIVQNNDYSKLLEVDNGSYTVTQTSTGVQYKSLFNGEYGSSSALAFNKDETTFLDSEKADTELKKISESIKNVKTYTIDITGYQDLVDGKCEYGSISLDRANVIKDKLGELGLSKSDIKVLDAVCNGANGNGDNRKVTISIEGA